MSAEEQVDMSGAASEEEMRAAYEAELNRITSGEMILQSTVSLLNIGGRRLGLGGGPAAERDMDQVSDAIDGARALMPILERRMPAAELGPLRDAISQLQMAYAREMQGARDSVSNATPGTTAAQPPSAASPAVGEQPQAPEKTGAVEQPGAHEKVGEQPEGEQPQAPGPAQASGRLWVPGR